MRPLRDNAIETAKGKGLAIAEYAAAHQQFDLGVEERDDPGDESPLLLS